MDEDFLSKTFSKASPLIFYEKSIQNELIPAPPNIKKKLFFKKNPKILSKKLHRGFQWYYIACFDTFITYSEFEGNIKYILNINLFKAFRIFLVWKLVLEKKK